MSQSEEYQKISIVVVGDENVGKTALARIFAAGDVGAHNQKGIIPIQSFNGLVNIDDETIHLEVKCLSGKEKYREITSYYYHAAYAVVFVYDVNNADTFHNIRSFFRDFKEHNIKVPAILVGNKTDLPRKVTEKKALDYARKNNMHFMEVSTVGENAKQRVLSLFDRVGRVAYNACLENEGHLPLGDEYWSNDESSEEDSCSESESASSESTNDKTLKNPHARLLSYVDVLSKLNPNQWSKNDNERGLAKAHNLKKFYLKDDEPLTYFQLTRLLGNPKHLLDNRSKLPFKPYKWKCFLFGEYNVVLGRVCESKLEKLLVDCYNSVKPR